MRTREFLYIVMMLFLTVVPTTAQEKDTLSVFIENNPNAVDFNVIHEGTKLNLTADDDFLMINLSIAHPALQMRFLMQKVSLYIDPSGKKRKNYEIVLPSAMDVKDELEKVNPQTAGKKDADTRPDIRPVIAALNKQGADYNCEKLSQHLGYQHFHIGMDTKNELLNYYVLIPKEKLMQDRKLSDIWTLGIFSINDMANMPPPEQDGEEGGMMPPPMEGENQEDIQELMQSDIRLWTKFSIDDVNNANEPVLSPVPNTVKIEALECGDSLEFKLTAYQIETQLTFLMQGMEMTAIQQDTLTMSFPSAAMVRNKVRRHPNEVKAVLNSVSQAGKDSVNHVVRPDVQPLVAALNDTTAVVAYQGKKENIRDFKIDVDREMAIMSFSVRIARAMVSDNNGMVQILVTSVPPNHQGDRPEFSGRRLSGENAPLPNGLGEGLRKEDIEKRTFLVTFPVRIIKDGGKRKL